MIIVRFIWSLLLLLFTVSHAWSETVTIVALRSESSLPHEEVISGFKEELEQRDIRFLVMKTDQDRENLAEKLGELRPKLVLCIGSKALEQASGLRDIPKVFTLITASDGSLYRQRPDVFGVTIDLTPRAQFEMIKKVFPGRRRIGIIYNPGRNQFIVEEARRAAGRLNLNLHPYPVSSTREIPVRLQQLENRVDILWSVYDQTVYSQDSARYILLHAIRMNIPFIGFSPRFAKAGAAMALYGDYRDMGRQAGRLASSILKKEEVQSRILPPLKVRIAINEKVMKAMGIPIPRHILNMSDHVY